jgi:hypothetical protein
LRKGNGGSRNLEINCLWFSPLRHKKSHRNKKLR